jgi:predicted neuraminidase
MFSLILLLCLTVVEAPKANGVVTTEFIFTEAPFPQCHASTLAETKSGLVAAWFGGKHEKHPSVGIWLSRQVDGKWIKPIEVANGDQPEGKDRQPCWNPVLFQPKKGPLMLFYKVGPSPRSWWGELITSEDEGQTWSKPRKLPEGILGPIKNKPIELADGTILSGVSTESKDVLSKWRVHFERSEDNGQTWTKTADVGFDKPIQAIQPSILALPKGQLQALGRSKSGKIFSVLSSDHGKTWGKMALLDLPNPSSGTDAVTMSDGRHVLIYNHTAILRSPLNVAVSDDGKKWQAALTLESEPGEYSYPAVIQTKDGLLHFSYTWKRQRIKHVVVDPKKLTLTPIVDGKWPGMKNKD